MINHARVASLPSWWCSLCIGPSLFPLASVHGMKVYAHSFQISNALPLRTSVKRRNSKTNTTLLSRCPVSFLSLTFLRSSNCHSIHSFSLDRNPILPRWILWIRLDKIFFVQWVISDWNVWRGSKIYSGIFNNIGFKQSDIDYIETYILMYYQEVDWINSNVTLLEIY